MTGSTSGMGRATATALAADLSDPRQVAHLAQEAGDVDISINNAVIAG